MLSKFEFPTMLDLSGVAAAESGATSEQADTQEYDLLAILVHKGSSASHGHYGGFCVVEGH